MSNNCLELQLITVRLTKGYSTTIPVYDAFTSWVEERGKIPITSWVEGVRH